MKSTLTLLVSLILTAGFSANAIMWTPLTEDDKESRKELETYLCNLGDLVMIGTLQSVERDTTTNKHKESVASIYDTGFFKVDQVLRNRKAITRSSEDNLLKEGTFADLFARCGEPNDKDMSGACPILADDLKKSLGKSGIWILNGDGKYTSLATAGHPDIPLDIKFKERVEKVLRNCKR